MREALAGLCHPSWTAAVDVRILLSDDETLKWNREEHVLGR